MSTPHFPEENLRRSEPRNTAFQPQEPLTRFLSTHQAIAVSVNSLRELIARKPTQAAIDLLETQAAQNLRFAEASSWTEKILNVCGRESTRQSLLKQQAEQAYTDAAEAKKLMSDIEKTVAKGLQQLIESHFVLSPDLGALRQTLRAAVQRETNREAAWNAVDLAATRLDDKLRPRGLAYGYDPRYQPPQFIPPAVESHQHREYRIKAVQQKYHQGRETDLRLVTENAGLTAPLLARFLSNVVYSINSVDGTFSEPVQPCSEAFREAATALIEMTRRIDALPRATADAPSVTSRIHAEQMRDAFIKPALVPAVDKVYRLVTKVGLNPARF